MPLTTKRRELKNCRLYFIPAGVVVDTVTVSRTTWPDDNPVSNWTDWQFDDIEKVVDEKTFFEETFPIPKASGGYFNDDESTLQKRSWVCTSSKTNSILKQLEHMLASVPVVGAAQAPNVKSTAFIDGVVLTETQLATGVVSERTQVWARLKLSNAGETGPATAKLEFRFEHLDSGNNTYILAA